MNTAGNQTFKSCLSAGEGESFLFSAVNGEVQAWDAADGRQVWKHAVNGEVLDLKVLPGGKSPTDLVILSKHDKSAASVSLLTADTGKVLWTFYDDR